MAGYRLVDKLEWRSWVTPKPLLTQPIHRWFVFPHSFSRELVHALMEEWNLGPTDRLLDPFVGAGTTIVAAKEARVPAAGYDLSPLAVLSAKTKVAPYDRSRLRLLWSTLEKKLVPSRWNGPVRQYPELVEKALPGKLLGAFDAVYREIAELRCTESERDFFRLALLSTIPTFSRAVATGGWLSWNGNRRTVVSLPNAFAGKVQTMLNDISSSSPNHNGAWRAGVADARWLPERADAFSAVITSPPYPNRHDYTRVFGIELLFGFLDQEGIRDLRCQSVSSHPEARPRRPPMNGYRAPRELLTALSQVEKQKPDPRVPRMLAGYFLDMYLVLREVRRVCGDGARLALVLGNAQYYGVPLNVDELVAEIGEEVGLTCTRIRIVRYRGNSAQQMGKFGRNPSRESVVEFRAKENEPVHDDHPRRNLRGKTPRQRRKAEGDA